MTEEEQFRVFSMLLAKDEELSTLGAAAFTTKATWADYRELRAHRDYKSIPFVTRKILIKEIAHHWGNRDDQGKHLRKYKGV